MTSTIFSHDLKVARANEHLETLRIEENRYLDTNPCELEQVVRSPDSNGRGILHDLVWKRYVPPRNEVGSIVGDAIHNLRSALDHLAFQLALKGAGLASTTLTEDEARGIQFPITFNQKDFSEQAVRKLRYVTVQARNAIEQAQPFNTHSSAPGTAPFADISRIDITDKHRSLKLSTAQIRLLHDNWPEAVRGCDLEYPREKFTGEPGTIYGTYRFPVPLSKAEVPIEFSYGLVLADQMRQDMGIVWILEHLIRVVTFRTGSIAQDFLT